MMSSSTLKILRHPDHSLAWWYKVRSSIDFDPPYQRKINIWSDYDKAFLIDSILNGFDIPKFYVSDFGMRSSSLERDNSVYAIIDGKQRFGAIFQFFDGDLRLNHDFVWRFDSNLNIAGATYKDLREDFPTLARQFDSYVLDIMSVSTDEPDDINEMFKRLNKGKALVGAEVRNAALGRVADLIRVIASHDFFRHCISFSTRRLADQNAAAKILLFEFRGHPVGTKKRDLDEFVRSDAENVELIGSAGIMCEASLDLMMQIFEEHDPLMKSPGLLPVYYWFIRLLPVESHAYVRPFLEYFEDSRDASRLAQSEGRVDEVSNDLARYDVLNRSTNDVGSHRARIGILLKWFLRVMRQDDDDLTRQVAAVQERFQNA